MSLKGFPEIKFYGKIKHATSTEATIVDVHPDTSKSQHLLPNGTIVLTSFYDVEIPEDPNIILKELLQ